MRLETLDVLRCPFCGGRLEIVTSMHHLVDGDEVDEAILGCHCCIFPVVAGIPVLHLQPEVQGIRELVEAGRGDRAFQALSGVTDEDRGVALEALRSSERATYRDAIGVLGPEFEGDYLLYRFSDPNHVVAQAVNRAVAGVVLRDGGRALDLCGGSGHLTRVLSHVSSPSPVVADRSFAQVWLARRFVAPGAEAVCCDANGPLPFARGAFSMAICADAFQYVWTKRQAIAEMERVVDAGDRPAAVLINHTHNQHQWSPSLGMPLPPDGYRDLFETFQARVFSELELLSDVVAGGPLDLSRPERAEVLEADPALTVIASRYPDVFATHTLDAARVARGELRINPLYAVETDGELLRLKLAFPSEFYEQEYGGCREYLPTELVLEGEDLAALKSGRVNERIGELTRRRIVLDLPANYF
jgi:uncharacterized protein YbaR (Trm112 family)